MAGAFLKIHEPDHIRAGGKRCFQRFRLAQTTDFNINRRHRGDLAVQARRGKREVTAKRYGVKTGHGRNTLTN
jgi:hypothetical protein